MCLRHIFFVAHRDIELLVKNCRIIESPKAVSTWNTEQLKAKLVKRDLTSTCHPQGYSEHLGFYTTFDYDDVTIVTVTIPCSKCTELYPVRRPSWHLTTIFHNSFAQLEFTDIDIFGRPSGKAASNTRAASIWACTEALHPVTPWDTLGIYTINAADIMGQPTTIWEPNLIYTK